MRRAFLRSEAGMSNDDVRPTSLYHGDPATNSTFTLIQGGATPAPARHMRDETTFVAIAVDDLCEFELALKMLTPCPRNPHRFHEWKDELLAVLREWASRLPVPNVPA
jgi:hypothetical protein